MGRIKEVNNGNANLKRRGVGLKNPVVQNGVHKR